MTNLILIMSDIEFPVYHPDIRLNRNCTRLNSLEKGTRANIVIMTVNQHPTIPVTIRLSRR